MQDKTGESLVMDFGLARSLESAEGMTQTGALLGTIEYMSPEQAMGKLLDARSIYLRWGQFYELLSGNIPYKADTAMASLLKRNVERAVPVAELTVRYRRDGAISSAGAWSVNWSNATRACRKFWRIWMLGRGSGRSRLRWRWPRRRHR